MSSKYTPTTNTAAQNQVVQWINDAGMVEGHKRADLLRKAIEVLLHQAASSIPTYLDNVLSYVNDKHAEVKKLVITFIEELSKLHPEYLPKVIGQLRLLVINSVVAVQKRAIQAASIIYRNTLLWICKEEADVADMQIVWQHLAELKLIVLNMIDSENEGIRTHSIKFLEEAVLLQSPGGGEGDFTLDDLPDDLPFLDRRALEEEAEHIFTLLVKFHNSQHISSVNLMACMTSLCLVARVRPRFAPRVLKALADLHTTLPPTLSQSQVNSVRKHLKMLLLNMLKHPTSPELLPQLTQLLTDAGMSMQEISRSLPRDRRAKRLGEVKNGDAPTKRFRVDSPQSNSQGSDSNSRSDFVTFDEDSSSMPAPAAATVSSTIIPSPAPVPVPAPVPPPVTEDSLAEGLDSVDNVVELVMSTLLENLPEEMPENFTNAYKPIPNSGSKAQKRSLAKMLIQLIEDEPTLPLPATVEPRIPLLRDEDEKTTLKNAVAKLQESTRTNLDRKVESAVTRLMEETRQDHLKEEERRTRDRDKPVPPQTPTVPKLKQKVKLLRLQEITRPIPKEVKERLVLGAVSRILAAERDCAIGGASHVRAKFVALFAAGYTPALRDLVLDHVLAAPAARLDLALAWLYEEYAFMQGFNRHPVTLQPKIHEKHDQNYNQLLCALVTQIYERGDPATEGCKDGLLRRIYAEAPLVTDEAAEYLRHVGGDPRGAPLALDLLEELCATRPPRAHKYAPSLLCHVLSEDEQTRSLALAAAVRLHARSGAPHARLRKAVEKHALLYLGFVALAQPPSELPAARQRQPWTDELYKICLGLVMAIFPQNEELIVEVGRVYGCASAEAKRCVLRVAEGPLRACAQRARAQGSALPAAFAALLDECPRGADTLLTRLVHMLTERAPPSPELVSRVRELYATRVSDVRFLIPVLTGLSKNEILAALPKLIKLNPMVVKEVFNKLLGLQNPGDDLPPVTPADLLVALHLIDPATADLKYIIKATALCFAEKQTYTQDVVSSVLQRLSEEAEVPVLMMRSVLQALTLYPGLAPLVLNMLQLLVEKEVWNYKVAWEGWVKCCERLLPRSVFLLAALPARGLAALPAALAAALQHHVAALPPHDRAQLPPHLAALLRQEQPFTPPPGNPVEPLPPGME